MAFYDALHVPGSSVITVVKLILLEITLRLGISRRNVLF